MKEELKDRRVGNGVGGKVESDREGRENRRKRWVENGKN